MEPMTEYFRARERKWHHKDSKEKHDPKENFKRLLVSLESKIHACSINMHPEYEKKDLRQQAEVESQQNVTNEVNEEWNDTKIIQPQN